MKKLLIAAWIVFALDLGVLSLMIRAVLAGDFGQGADGEEQRAFATTVTIGSAVWLCGVNLALLVGWWRDSRGWLWAAIIAGAVPLMWAWTAVVQAIADAASPAQ